MTVKRLEELKNKFSAKQGDIQDLGEILTALFKSSSQHLKEIKDQVGEIRFSQELMNEELDQIKELLIPVFTIIHTDDLEETEEDEEDKD